MIYRLALAAFLISPPPAYSQAPDPCAQSPQTCATLINTHATARTRIPNTAVDVSLTIASEDKDLPTVQHVAAVKSEALLKYLRSQNVERLITTSTTLRPETKYEKNGPNKIVAYSGIVKISFRTVPDHASDILTGVLANGATSIDSTTFTPTEDQIASARRQLAAEASKTAIAQADSVAQAAGLHVVSVRQLSVDSDPDLRSLQNSLQTNGYISGFTGGGGQAQVSPEIQTASGDQALAITVYLVAAAAR